MAEKEKAKKPTSKKAKKRLKGITHHVAEDGGFVHEHHYHDGSSSFGGYSPDLADVHQHIDDHLTPEATGGGAPGGGGEEEAEAAPQGGAPGGGGPPAPGGGGMEEA